MEDSLPIPYSESLMLNEIEMLFKNSFAILLQLKEDFKISVD